MPEQILPEWNKKQPPKPWHATSFTRSEDESKVSTVPYRATSLNVEDHRAVLPLQGFGKLWQKTYKVRLGGVKTNPRQVMSTWKENYAAFWPKCDKFHAPLRDIAADEVVLPKLGMPRRVRLSTGVILLHADDESFSLLTPPRHPFSGWITFSASDKDSGTTAQVQTLMRAFSPFYEVGLRLGIHEMQDEMWKQMLRNLAAFFGVRESVEATAVCVEPKLQWRQYSNVWHNADLRSSFHMIASPLRWCRDRACGR